MLKDETYTLMRRLIEDLGENPERPGLLETPARATKALRFLTSGYDINPRELVGGAIFEESNGELVLLKNIEFFSLCEHHMLPFFGKVHVAYVPNRKIIGLSKIPRLVDVFARRLQVQERLTHQIATELEQILAPKGVAVVMEASHLCMMMRGVEKQGGKTVTKSTLGVFRENAELRRELFTLLGQD